MSGTIPNGFAMTPRSNQAVAGHQRFSDTQTAARIIEAESNILNCPFLPAVSDAGKAKTVTRQKRLATVGSARKNLHIRQIAQPKRPKANAR